MRDPFAYQAESALVASDYRNEAGRAMIRQEAHRVTLHVSNDGPKADAPPLVHVFQNDLGTLSTPKSKVSGEVAQRLGGLRCQEWGRIPTASHDPDSLSLAEPIIQ